MSEKQQAYNLIVVLGPTATGKTRFAAELAYQIRGEIISADSRQIYRRMDLGTGKDYSDYEVQGTRIPTHLIDIHEPGYKYNVYEFQQDFMRVYSEINDRGKQAILCGGSGMYIEAVSRRYRLIEVPANNKLREKLESKSLRELEAILSGYRSLHNTSDTDSPKRAIRAIEIEEYYRQHPQEDSPFPELHPLYLGIVCDRGIRRQRITHRLHSRLKEGMIDEVQRLLDEGIAPDDLIYYGLEYKYITQHLTGILSYDAMLEKLNTAIHQFAKRQMTWFRKMERQGTQIFWINSELEMEEKLRLAQEYLTP